MDLVEVVFVFKVFEDEGGIFWIVMNIDWMIFWECGVVLGNGIFVLVVYIVVGRLVIVVGKLEKLIFEEVLVCFGVWKVFFIGDCFDIDIMGVNWVGIDFVFVFIGIDCFKYVFVVFEGLCLMFIFGDFCELYVFYFEVVE